MANPIFDKNNLILTLRDVYVVNCRSSPNVERSISVFTAMCPQQLMVVVMEQNYGNHDHPCRWLVKYQLRYSETNFENAKASFEDILRVIPLNTKFVDKHIGGPPCPTYNVIFAVTNCACPQLDFESENFFIKQ